MATIGDALTGRDARRVHERLLDLAGRDLPPTELFARADDLLRTVIPFDASGWLTTDPATGLATGVAMVTGVPEATAAELLEHEIIDPGMSSFGALAQAAFPVAIQPGPDAELPAPEARRRELRSRHDFGPELRAALALDGALWGTLCMARMTGEPGFTEAEARFVARIAQPLAHAVRRSVLIETTDRPPASAGPGMLIVTGDGRIESATEPARAWLDELAGDLVHGDGDRVPAAVFTVAMRSLRIGTDPHASRVRLRTATGTWLTVYASPLRGPDGVERAAVVIEPARRAEVAPVVAQAYGLSAREREVLALVAQGLSIDAIARRLVISLHTARDHVKRIQAKVRVTSRAELVSKLYVEHYAPATA
jgi:DNA-binding CsgD family transcriptional regulator